MAEPMAPTQLGASLEVFPTPDREPHRPTDGGLRSTPGIRWLLLAGALVSVVSLYRLVESQWELIPVMAQYLVLVLAALGVYAVGELTHRRLRLPLAGSALLLPRVVVGRRPGCRRNRSSARG